MVSSASERRGRARLGAIVAAIAFAAAAPGASADNLDEFGFGPRPSAMGGAFTALASDWTATFYNPAGLIGSKHVNLGLGFQYAGYALDFTSARGGSAVDERATRVEPLSAFTFGTSSTIPLDEPDRIAFGIGLFLPTRKIVDVTGRTPSAEPDWILYGDHSDRLHVLPALAVKIVDGLSIGAGVNVFAVADGSVGIQADLSSPISQRFSLRLKPDAGAIVGLFFQPATSLSFGVVYRTERSFKLKLPVSVSVQGIELPLVTELLTLFEPHQFAVGAAWNPLDGPVLVSLDVTWMNWSAFKDVVLVVSSQTFPVPQRIKSDFDDTVVFRLGVEWSVLKWLAVRGGYSFRPSPAPDPEGPTTLLDTDKHMISFGLGFTWEPGGGGDEKKPDGKGDAKDSKDEPAAKKASGFSAASFDLDVFFQWHILPERHASRSSATDPLGPIDFGGGIWNLGVGIAARF